MSNDRHYEALKTYAEETLWVKKYLYQWSAQDLSTLDKVPYVSWITSAHPNVFVATGFKKWGGNDKWDSSRHAC
ncbi:hypothetical protein [Heyndrickxia acidicola]|uniref:Uncharacterized protein n=1 Tax=Heyndrickxia acidicola TaxID=209389 RepID=A0ABU6MB19_9BACI|nr:hypothetical protein [Heyndrickxia acidicola]MED1201577.1 hypothetical protein [Heyndrickxia acidicola]